MVLLVVIGDRGRGTDLGLPTDSLEAEPTEPLFVLSTVDDPWPALLFCFSLAGLSSPTASVLIATAASFTASFTVSSAPCSFAPLEMEADAAVDPSVALDPPSFLEVASLAVPTVVGTEPLGARVWATGALIPDDRREPSDSRACRSF